MPSRTPFSPDFVEPVRVFVYGTLRRGGRANALLRGCECLGVRRVRGTLYDVRGAYPALVLDEEGEVEGEVWRCPGATIAALDEYEGVAQGLYRRMEVQVEGAACWTYVAGPALEPVLTPERRIASGVWPR